MPPKVIARAERATGVLPVSGAARAASAKQSSARLKLEIRRLPPSLTLTEFEEVLGPEWKLGNGRIDWREYRQGKVRSPGKLPEQSRCYVHLTNEIYVKDFEQRFLAIVFHDKAGTHKLVELKYLPPTLEYAPSQRVPITTGKQRVDNRQGTIDQDSEFIAFLEAETQPIAKTPAMDLLSLEREESAKQEVKSTPLIDDLREKKANKARAAASKAEKKGHKHADSKDAAAVVKDTAKAKDKVEVKKADVLAKDGKTNKAVVAKPTAQASATQQGATPRKKKERPPPSPKPVDATPTPPAAPASPAPQRATPAQRARRDAEGIKKMLQKDLGIKPKDGTTPTAPARARAAQSAGGQVPVQPPTGPKAANKATPVIALETSVPAPQTPAVPTSTTVKAFLKHANPSQGMTEPLIQSALSSFGEVVGVTIDPRKGTAIAVFTSQEGLQKAIAAKKISVANGAVEILEFKDRGAGAARGSRGAARGNRGKGNTAGAATTPTASASAVVPS